MVSSDLRRVCPAPLRGVRILEVAGVTRRVNFAHNVRMMEHARGYPDATKDAEEYWFRVGMATPRRYPAEDFGDWGQRLWDARKWEDSVHQQKWDDVQDDFWRGLAAADRVAGNRRRRSARKARPRGRRRSRG